jgi:dTDP-4-dehydrorhamnose 3,5-epimerase
MGQLKAEPTAISGLWYVETDVIKDPEREGCEFVEQFRTDQLRNAGVPLDHPPVQFNKATSLPGTLRGIHVAPWYKFVFTLTGLAHAVICDPRPDSATFGRYVSFQLSGGNALFVSAGLGNSYQAVGQESVTYCYLVDQLWSAGKEWGIAWDDRMLGIEWPVTDNRLQLSSKDQNNPSLFEAVKR